MSFSYDYTDYSSGTIDQGTLASSYSNALSSFLRADGADHVAFIAHAASGLAVDDALALKALVERGEFSLSGLFGAAQSSTGSVDAASIANPKPMLSATLADGRVVSVDLSAMLTGLDSETWTTQTRVGKSAGTVYHTREFYSGSQIPGDYAEDWAAAQNAAPTATAITAEIDEYDEHADGADRSGTPQLTMVDLLDPAHVSDADGDSLSVVEGSVKIDNGDGTYSDLPPYISYADGVLSIDRNSAEFDSLYLNDTLNLTIVYQISDGVNDPVDNVVDLSITGSADQFSDSAAITVEKIGGGAYTAGGSYALLGFDWRNVEVDVSGFGDFDHFSESFTVTLDVNASYTGAGTTANSEAGFIAVDPSETLDASWSADGDLDYAVEFKAPVDGHSAGDPDASTVGISLVYDYWM